MLLFVVVLICSYRYMGLLVASSSVLFRSVSFFVSTGVVPRAHSRKAGLTLPPGSQGRGRGSRGGSNRAQTAGVVVALGGILGLLGGGGG